MKRYSVLIVFLAISQFFRIDVANAWWSVPYYSGGESTHYRLGQAAMSLVTIDAIQYPDIYKLDSFQVAGDRLILSADHKEGGHVWADIT